MQEDTDKQVSPESLYRLKALMDVFECIRKRKSVRWYTQEMPSREMIEQCLEAASWAPNPTSQQPWKFIVLTGTALQQVSSVIADSYGEAAAAKAELPEPPVPEKVKQELASRKSDNFGAMISFLQEQGADMDLLGSGIFSFQHAPVGVIFGVYPDKGRNYFKATVAAMENFMLAATAQGLGTCWMNAISICQEAIKATLGLEQELVLVDGLALGYPDQSSPVNHIPRQRLPVDAVTMWLDEKGV
jgi:nitroreductase